MSIKTYRTVIPVPLAHSVADEVTVWLARESFDRAAAADAATLIEFVDAGTLAPEDVPPKAVQQLGQPADAFVWRVFEGVGERPDA